MTNYPIGFTNQMNYEELYRLVSPSYIQNRINQTDQIYLHNQNTEVVYVLDHQVYYTKIGYKENGQNWQDIYIRNVPKISYKKMSGSDKTYSHEKILVALKQPRNFYFPNGQMNHKNVDGQTRAIALFCESIRFDAIHTALLRGAMGEGTPWEESWGTLANNWDRITEGQFTIPVPNAAVCVYMRSLPADAKKRTDFKKSINMYLDIQCNL